MSQKSEYQVAGVDDLLQHLEDPYPFFASLREQKELVYSPQVDAWLVTRYNDVLALLTQPDVFSSVDLIGPVVTWSPAALAILQQGYPITQVSINSDGINHERFRAPHTRGFSAARMKVREPFVQELANRLVDAFIDDGHAELVSQFAYQFSLETILNLFGVPRAHIEEVKEWGKALTDFIFGGLESEESQIACASGLVAFQKYCARLIEERRASPQDTELDALIRHQVDGALPLSEAELISAIMGFLTAGHRSTVDACISGFVLLLQKPSLWQTICARPELIPAAVEEILRYESATQTLSRVTTQEVELGGTRLPKGARLLALIGAANRDEEHFSDAHVFDIERTPNRHIAFGHGIHFCVGAPAARMELRIALEIFARRLPGLRLVQNQQLVHNHLLIFRGYQKLEVEW